MSGGDLQPPPSPLRSAFRCARLMNAQPFRETHGEYSHLPQDKRRLSETHRFIEFDIYKLRIASLRNQHNLAIHRDNVNSRIHLVPTTKGEGTVDFYPTFLNQSICCSPGVNRGERLVEADACFGGVDDSFWWW